MEFQGAIFDVYGVLVDSPHDQAWREALRDLMDGDWRDIRDRTAYSPERFTKTVYQQVMAGLPRLAGARAVLEYFKVPDSGTRARQYAAAKRNLATRMAEAGQLVACADGLRFVLMAKNAGIPVAAACSL